MLPMEGMDRGEKLLGQIDGSNHDYGHLPKLIGLQYLAQMLVLNASCAAKR